MLQSIVRYSVLALFAFLAGHGIISKDQITDATTNLVVNVLIASVTALGAIVWSWIQKERAKAATSTANIALPIKPVEPPQTTSGTALPLAVAGAFCLALFLGGCSSAQLKTVATDAGAVTVDVNSVLTAANAIWTAVGQTLSQPQIQSLLRSYGLSASQYASIESILGLGSATGTTSVQVTSALAATLDAYAASLK